MAIHVFHIDEPDRMLPLIARDARLVVWPGRGSQTANMNYVNLHPGEANVPHVHAGSEDTIYILDGQGTIDDLTNGTELPFSKGDTIHVPVGVRHAVKADRGTPVRSCGGPAPTDWAMMALSEAYDADLLTRLQSR